MRSRLLAIALLAGAALPLSATTIETLIITGNDIDDAAYQVTFSFHRGSPTHGSSADSYGLSGPGTIDLVSDTFNRYEHTGADTCLDLCELNCGGNYRQQLVFPPDIALFGNSAAPNINVGSNSGYDDTGCDALLHAASFGSSGPFSALALFKLPALQTDCGNLVSVSATSSSSGLTPPSGFTPESASLALFGTGALGLFGVARRRFAR